MKRAVAVLACLGAALCASLALADRTSLVYASDAGTASVPRLTARRAVEIFNGYTVAICVAAGSTATSSQPCRPIIPGGSMSLDVSDAAPYTFRLCSGATVASCFTGDAGVVVTEVQ